MSEGKFKVYGLQFEYEGSLWAFDLPARNLEDLKARLQLLPNAQILGVIEGTVPEDHPAFHYVPLYTKIRNQLIGMLRDKLGGLQLSGKEIEKRFPVVPQAKAGEAVSERIPGMMSHGDKSHIRIIRPLQPAELAENAQGSV